jgi:hypothetical protein
MMGSLITLSLSLSNSLVMMIHHHPFTHSHTRPTLPPTTHLFTITKSHRIFHGIDFPLRPPFASNFTKFTHMSTDIDTSDCFRFFRQTLLSSGDISDMFNSTVTLWCPTGDAFGFFPIEYKNRLLTPEWVRHATEFLLNYMSKPARTRQEWVNMAPGYIEMLNGANVEWGDVRVAEKWTEAEDSEWK